MDEVSGAVIAGIVVLIIAVVSGAILWSIYYFTDVFDDPRFTPQFHPAPMGIIHHEDIGLGVFG